MKLLSVHVENFGRLHDYDRDFSTGINRITEKNGWGKTTFSAFLLVMFYGFDDKQTKKLRERYAPWNGGTYGGSIIFEVGGRSYIIERTFGHKKSIEDTFVLRDGETNLALDDYDEYIGDELFKINTESFMKTVFIGTNGCITATTDDINAKIGDLSMVDADMRSYSEAQKMLADYLNQNSDTRKTGKIYALKEKEAEFRNKARFARGITNEMADCDNMLEALSKEEAELEREKNEITALQTTIVKCKEAVLSYEKYKVLRSSMEAAKKAKDEPFPENMVSGIVMYSIGILLIIVGALIFLFENRILGIVSFAAAVILLTTGMVTTFKREKRRSAWSENNEKTYDNAVKEFVAFVNCTDMEEVRKYASMPEAAYALKDTDQRRSEITDRLDKVKKELQKLDTRREFLCEELLSSEAAESRANEISRQVDEGLEKLENVRRTEMLLEEAKVNFALRFLEPLKKSLTRYFRILKGDKAANCRLDANLVLTLEENGKQRSEEAFSDGIRNALGLCMRFALIDAMYPEEAPFVIMDDPFMHFDTETRDAAMKLLQQVPYQIILLQKK